MCGVTLLKSGVYSPDWKSMSYEICFEYKCNEFEILLSQRINFKRFFCFQGKFSLVIETRCLISCRYDTLNLRFDGDFAHFVCKLLS